MGVGTTVGIWTVGVGTVVRMDSVRTTDQGWLAATTPVPKGRKSKRRVSAGGFMRSARRNAQAVTVCVLSPTLPTSPT